MPIFCPTTSARSRPQCRVTKASWKRWRRPPPIDVRQTNRELDKDVYTNASDPTETYVPPKREPAPQDLDFAPMKHAVDALAKAAAHYSEVHAHAMENGSALASASLGGVNQKLYMTERALTERERPAGPPVVQAPALRAWFLYGYGVKTIPAVREAIEQKQWQLAQEQIGVVAGVLEKAAAAIDDAASALQAAVH